MAKNVTTTYLAYRANIVNYVQDIMEYSEASAVATGDYIGFTRRTFNSFIEGSDSTITVERVCWIAEVFDTTLDNILHYDKNIDFVNMIKNKKEISLLSKYSDLRRSFKNPNVNKFRKSK